MSFDAVGIISESPERSVKFFKILGVEIKQYADSGHYEGMTSSGVRIMLDSVDFMKAHEPNWKKAQGGGITLCFKQESPQKVDELYEAFIGADFKGIKAPWNAFWGHRYACVSDPDGNQIDLFAPL